MAKILYTNYNTGKTQAKSALTTTGAAFTWTQTVAVGTKAKAVQILEIQDALNTAYNAINTGCVTQNSSVKGSNNGSYNSSQNSVCGTNRNAGNTYNSSG